MTRKETLLTQKYELQNTLRTLRGEEPRDITLLTTGWKFQQAVRDAREYSLKQEIAQLETAIANQKAENEKKAKTEAYFATEEGKAQEERRPLLFEVAFLVLGKCVYFTTTFSTSTCVPLVMRRK